MELKAQIRSQLLFRIAFLAVMMGSAGMIWAFYGDQPAAPLVTFAALGFGFSAVSALAYWLLPRNQLPWLLWIQVAWDLGAATYLMSQTGGASSLFLILFFIQILFTSVTSGSRGAMVSTLLAIALIAGLSFWTLGWKASLQPLMMSKLLFIVSALSFLGGCLAFISRNRERLRTSLERTSTELRDLSHLHAAIVEHSPSGILSIDREGIVLVMNRTAEKILGENLVGRSLKSTSFAELFRRGERSETRMEVRGETRSIGHQCVELPQQGWLIIFQDVTEIRDLEARMKLKEKLASVGQLAAGIAHEIRNPLASLSGSIQLLKGELPADSGSEKLMKIVLRETDRLDSLLQNFLMYAKPSELRPVRVEIKKTLLDIVALMKNRGIGAKKIELDIPDSLHCICDPVQFSQILWNLVLNALQASKDDGVVIVSARERSLMDGGRIHFEVKDRGVGVPASLRDRIFEPFFTTKAEGTGLGLPLVYQMVKAHGGQLGIESEEGRGSTFWFELFREGPKAPREGSSLTAA